MEVLMLANPEAGNDLVHPQKQKPLLFGNGF
jgi:hypothetical protein